MKGWIAAAILVPLAMGAGYQMGRTEADRWCDHKVAVLNDLWARIDRTGQPAHIGTSPASD